MKIDKLIWNFKSGQEAELTITESQFTYIALSHPLAFSKGE